MSEETGITVIGALGIVAAVVLAVVLIRYLLNPQSPGSQSGPAQEPNRP